MARNNTLTLNFHLHSNSLYSDSTSTFNRKSSNKSNPSHLFYQQKLNRKRLLSFQYGKLCFQCNRSRFKFMLEVIAAIRTNNSHKIPNYNPELKLHMKKLLRGLEKSPRTGERSTCTRTCRYMHYFFLKFIFNPSA